MTYPVVSLFSGAMGLDLGLEAAGLTVRIAQDADPWCKKTADLNQKPCIHGDIRSLLAADPSCQFLLDAAQLAPGEVFAVVGGPPCQSFSTAGSRNGIHDPRGSLFREFAHVVDALQPRFFVMENVKGLLSSSLVKPPQGKPKKEYTPEETPGSVFTVIRDTFEASGYTLTYGVVNAVDYGTPQFRERLLVIGSRDDEPVFLPQPTHFQKHQVPDYQWTTVGDAIETMADNPGLCGTFDAERIAFLKDIPMGSNWRALSPDRQEQALGGAYRSGGGKTGFFRRLDYRQPAPTLVTSPMQKATLLCHPVKHRPLSTQEYARLQEFPDDWQFAGSKTDVYRQIGNAVPVGLGKAIGHVLTATALNRGVIATKRVRGHH